MPADRDTIMRTINSYVALCATGTADEIVDLYAEGATVEDPIGSEVRTTRESIREFYSVLEGLEQVSTLLVARIGGGQAAFQFELATKAGDQTFTLAPIDVMTFDDVGKITSMKAYWSDEDMVVG